MVMLSPMKARPSKLLNKSLKENFYDHRIHELKNYRNYEELRMELSQGTNILYGDNAQGKTNILEAVYCVLHYQVPQRGERQGYDPVWRR